MLHPLQTATNAKRTYRELQLLMHFNHPDAQVCTKHSLIFFQTLSLYFMLKVVQLLNVFTPERNLNDFQTLYVEKILLFEEDNYFFLLLYRYFVFNFADYDLNRVIRRHIPFKEDHIKQIIYALLRGLKVWFLSFPFNINIIRYSSCFA
jgi:serine/threonine protein kinase